MKEAFKRIVKQAFGIREGELLRASFMQLMIFLIVTTLLIVKPTVNGLFLSEMGVEALPAAFILVALVAVLVSAAYTRFLARMPLNRILTLTLSASVGLFVIFGLLLRFNLGGHWTLYGLYIWVAIFGVLTASQFWILANVVFNAREAKRLFGFIGAGAIAGGIFGGYLTTLLAETLGSENLPFLAAGMLSLCIPITAYIWRRNVLPTQSKYQRRKKIPKTDRPYRLIRQSAHLTYLAGIIGVSVIVAKLVDYQFSAVASARIEDPNELTAFFGFWFSTFNVISLLVQVLLTRRLVGTFGVGSSLLFLPLAIQLGAVLLFIFPSLWAAIIIKISDGSLKQSVNKSAVELLALPIPVNIKSQTKTFIDVVVDSIATGLSGLLLIFFINGLDLSVRFISILITLLIIIWLLLIRRVRASYLHSFRLTVQQAYQASPKPGPEQQASVLGGMIRILDKGQEGQIMRLLQRLLQQPDERLADAIYSLLDHSSEQIQELAIRNLYFLKRDYVDRISTFTNHPSQAVKIAAFEYLLTHAPGKSEMLLETYLRDNNHRVRLAALVSLAEESRDNLLLKEKFHLRRRLNETFAEIGQIGDSEKRHTYKVGLLRAAGQAKLSDHGPMIEAFFTDPDQRVVSEAIAAAGMTLHPYFLPHLYKFLQTPSLRTASVEALTRYGAALIPELADKAQGSKVSLDFLRQIPLVLRNFGNQEAVDLLIRLLKKDDDRLRLAALRALNALKSQYPYLNFFEKELFPQMLKEAKLYQNTLSILYLQRNILPDLPEKALREARHQLINLLEKRLDHSLERMFRLLGLKFPPDEVIPIYQQLQDPKPDLRANAIEYLDSLLDTGLKKILMPIIETALLDAITEEAIRDLNLTIPNEEECYRELMESDDRALKQAVVNLLELRQIE